MAFSLAPPRSPISSAHECRNDTLNPQPFSSSCQPALPERVLQFRLRNLTPSRCGRCVIDSLSTDHLRLKCRQPGELFRCLTQELLTGHDVPLGTKRAVKARLIKNYSPILSSSQWMGLFRLEAKSARSNTSVASVTWDEQIVFNENNLLVFGSGLKSWLSLRRILPSSYFL